MKTINYTTIILFILMSLVYFGFKDKDSSKENNSVLTLDSKMLDANNISTWYRNNGSFNRNPSNGNSGFEWPRASGKYARYASGLWLGAGVHSDTLVTVVEYDYEFLPGYTDNNGNPQGKDDPLYKVYKLRYGINDDNRLQWPNSLLGNSNQGAPIYWDTIANLWKPLDFGVQTMYYVITDSYPESHGNNNGGTAPLKVDVKQINFSFDTPAPLNNAIYQQFTIINRSNQVWNNLYITIWTDDDLGEASDDRVGCDTSLNMGYTYNGDNDDPVYGQAPPAVSFILLKGPDIYTGNSSDTSFYCYSKEKRIRVGYRSQKMNVFNWYYNVIEPRNATESYRLMLGFDRDGNPRINPITGDTTKFIFSGDPVTNTGWVQTSSNDQRFLMSSGPINMNPNDTQIIIIAQLISRGTSNLNSITKLRQDAAEVINKYRECFYSLSIGITSNTNETPLEFKLYQNYPNPFNPVTKIRFDVRPPISPLLTKEGTTGVVLKIYDILGRKVATLVNEQLKPGTYEVEWDGSNYPSGVYYYRLSTTEFNETKKMLLIK